MSDDRRRIDCFEAIARNSARPAGVHWERDEAEPTEQGGLERQKQAERTERDRWPKRHLTQLGARARRRNWSHDKTVGDPRREGTQSQCDASWEDSWAWAGYDPICWTHRRS